MNDRDLAEARSATSVLADLLRREHAALADFLVALADFERAGTYGVLGYASLFDFLHRELGLSRAAAHYRKIASRLVARFPEVEAALRDGRLCLTSVVELARVITEENRDVVLPRYFHCSKQEARQVTAELSPAAIVARRTVVTTTPTSSPEPTPIRPGELDLTHPIGGPPTHVEGTPATASAARTTIQPLTATATRLHLTVSPEFVALLRKAKAGQSHVQPGATDEQVLTAALEFLLEKQAKRKACVPARLKREVVKRDGGKCTWPTHDGGVCGSTVRLEIDHVVPRGRGGPDTADNCHLLCDRHNQEAARAAYGDAHMGLFLRAPRAGEEEAAYSPALTQGPSTEILRAGSPTDARPHRHPPRHPPRRSRRGRGCAPGGLRHVRCGDVGALLLRRRRRHAGDDGIVPHHARGSGGGERREPRTVDRGTGGRLHRVRRDPRADRPSRAPVASRRGAWAADPHPARRSAHLSRRGLPPRRVSTILSTSPSGARWAPGVHR